MRLKEIKPGMAIHCKNDEEKKALLKEAERLGYRWIDDNKLPTDKTVCSGMTIHFHDHCLIAWSNNTKGVTEFSDGFSDLILPELTAEEVLDICHKICRGRKYCNECLMSGNCFAGEEPDFTKVIEICAQWKSDHEKKEPEIETVDICRIIEIQPDGRKRCVHEEDISDGELMYSGDAVEKCRYILKNYCMEHDGEFIAVHEVVSRVKK